MLARTALGLALLVGVVALGAAVLQLRRSERPVLRTLATKVHWGAGVVALAFLAVFAVTAARLLLG